jgi:hypothetical protein
LADPIGPSRRTIRIIMASVFRASSLPTLSPPERPSLFHRTWPLPALLGWSVAWGSYWLLRDSAGPAWLALGLATLAGGLCSLPQRSGWRRLIVAAGFPLSALLTGLVDLQVTWLWLPAMLLLAWTYPIRTWRDAPFFPTPPDALAELNELVELPDRASILDVGCGLGHGLQALRRVYPAARLHGVEWSRPLRWLAAWRCRWASVQQGDMWATHWGTHQMVYLFQRPESMPRAVAKAHAEMLDGSWLVSLEFAAPGLRPHAVLRPQGGRPVWIYRMAGSGRSASMARAAPLPSSVRPLRRVV